MATLPGKSAAATLAAKHAAESASQNDQPSSKISYELSMARNKGKITIVLKSVKNWRNEAMYQHG